MQDLEMCDDTQSKQHDDRAQWEVVIRLWEVFVGSREWIDYEFNHQKEDP